MRIWNGARTEANVNNHGALNTKAKLESCMVLCLSILAVTKEKDSIP